MPFGFLQSYLAKIPSFLFWFMTTGPTIVMVPRLIVSRASSLASTKRGTGGVEVEG